MYTLAKMSKMVLLATLLAAATNLACNTVKGAGKDIEKGGQTVENTADKVQHPK